MRLVNRMRAARAALPVCVPLLLCAVCPRPAHAQEPVRVSEQDVVIPTYLAGDPEPNPMFFFGRQSQGAEGRVYPYPLYDILTHRKADKTYRLVYLENEYVRIGILPEIGGRVFEGFDKTNNYDFFYRQHVIKPALIGLIGAWISGGIEWNIPHHHRATTFLPVQYRIEEGEDGSKTVWVGELEIRHRMRWAVGYTLHPGRSFLEAKVRIVNRTPVVNTMLAFANVAVHVNDQYQVVFPPRTQLGTHHHKRQFTRWPIADSRYGGGDFTGGVDISWYKNHVAANSVFAWNSDEDFVAGYDHGKQAGTMAIADHHVVPGKKFWTWGNGPRGRMWDRILTDEDGPYMEIMVGGYSDNQPDYSWLQPFETKSFEIYWYPFRAIGGAKQANVDAALNLEVREGVARVGFCTTSAQRDAIVRLAARDRVLLQETVAIDPAHPFVRDVRLPAGVAEHDLRASLTAGNRELVSYQPVRLDPVQMPSPVTDPPAPAAIKSVDELYQTGLWIEQFHNASLEPDPYWEEALRRDPGNTQVHTALGINRFKKARYSDAERHLRAALARLNERYATPKDAEATYYLGLTLKAQGKYDEAFSLLYKSTWDMAWRGPGYYEVAEIATLRGDLVRALDCTDRALDANALNLRAWNLKAALLRHMGRKDAALAALTGGAHRIDPLDARSMAERWLLTRQDDDVRRLRGALVAHRALPEELAAEYLNAGLWQDGSDVLKETVLARTGEPVRTSPVIYYYLAYFATRLAQQDETAKYYALARQASAEYVFPFESEAEVVLRAAMAANPGDARAPYYLGNLLYDWQPEQAVAAWEESARIDPTFPIVHRNLAVAYAHAGRPDGTAKAIASLEKAVSLPGPRYAMHFAELDRLYEQTAKPPEQRLKLLEANQQVVAGRDDALARLISLKVFAGKLDDAIQLLSSRQFSVWEGGSLNVRDPWTDAHILLGHQQRAAGRYKAAIDAYGTALTFPDNLASERLDSSARSAEVAYWTGVTREAMGDQAGARRAWESASSAPAQPRGPADQRFYEALALRKLGQEQAARARLQSLLDTATSTRDQAMGHYLAGLAHLGLNRQEQGRRELTKALELRSDLLAAKMALDFGYSIRTLGGASISAPPRLPGPRASTSMPVPVARRRPSAGRTR